MSCRCVFGPFLPFLDPILAVCCRDQVYATAFFSLFLSTSPRQVFCFLLLAGILKYGAGHVVYQYPNRCFRLGLFPSMALCNRGGLTTVSRGSRESK